MELIFIRVHRSAKNRYSRLRGKAQKKTDRTMSYSFYLTFIILAIAAVTINYLSSLPIIHHLPPTYDFRRDDWMKYIPQGAEKVSIFNFSQILMKTMNDSLFPNDRILVLYNFTTVLKISDVEFIASSLYQNPDPNSEDIALNIIKLKQYLYLALEEEIEEKGEMQFPFKNHTVVQVTGHVVNKPVITTGSTPEYVKAYIVMDEGYLLYSEGMRGLDLVRQSLDAAEGPNQYFEQQQVKASLYLLLSDEGDELGFSYSTFPYTVSGVSSTSTSIYYVDDIVTTRFVFAFASTDEASKGLDDIKKANLEATDFQIYDNYIVVTVEYDGHLLLRELRAL